MSFDEQPDGYVHGECAAESAPPELSDFEMWWAMLSKVPYMSKKEIASRAFYAGEMASDKSRFDACRPYLKEGETPAECLARNRMDIDRLMGFLATEKTARDTLQEDAARYRWARTNRLWLMANIPAMLHAGEFDAEIDKARAAQEAAG